MAPSEKKVKMTDEQMYLFLFSQRNTNAFHEYWITSLEGELDPIQLEKAAQMIVDRHEALRITKFKDGYQYISSHVDFKLNHVDLSVTSNLNDEIMLGHIKNEIDRPFDLTEGPDSLMRCTLFKIADKRYIFVFVVHHLAADGWSLGIIRDELITLYSNDSMHSNLLPEPVSYSSYLEWVESRGAEQREELESFWIERLSRTCKPNMFEMTNDSSLLGSKGVESFVLDVELVNELKKFSKKHAITLYMSLLSAYRILLYRLSDNEEIVIGTPVSGQLLMEANHLVGHCVKMLPLYVDLDDEKEVGTFVKEVKNEVQTATQYQHFSYEELMKLAQSRNIALSLPEIKTVFNMDKKLPGSITMPGLSITNNVELDEQLAMESKYNLFLDIVEDSNGELNVKFEFDKGIISEEVCKVWAMYYKNLLVQMVQNETMKLYELEM
ncbi:condensation domain-containing protein [Paenibacillus uliginis]|nr:condensation domain-containing protein [Paenibacillus uliginis]